MLIGASKYFGASFRAVRRFPVGGLKRWVRKELHKRACYQVHEDDHSGHFCLLTHVIFVFRVSEV